MVQADPIQQVPAEQGPMPVQALPEGMAVDKLAGLPANGVESSGQAVAPAGPAPGTTVVQEQPAGAVENNQEAPSKMLQISMLRASVKRPSIVLRHSLKKNAPMTKRASLAAS